MIIYNNGVLLGAEIMIVTKRVIMNFNQLSKIKKIIFIISTVLFLSEMIYVICDEGAYAWNFLLGNPLDLYWIYYTFFPLIYVVINIVLLYFNKINYITLLFFMILRVTYQPIAMFFVYTFIDIVNRF